MVPAPEPGSKYIVNLLNCSFISNAYTSENTGSREKTITAARSNAEILLIAFIFKKTSLKIKRDISTITKYSTIRKFSYVIFVNNAKNIPNSAKFFSEYGFFAQGVL